MPFLEGLKEKVKGLFPFRIPPKNLLKIECCFRLSAKKGKSQAAASEGDDVIWIDSQVLPAVFQDEIAILLEIHNQNADNLSRGRLGIDPESCQIIDDGFPVPHMVTGIRPRNVSREESGIDFQSPAVIGDGIGEAQLGSPDSSSKMIDRRCAREADQL